MSGYSYARCYVFAHNGFAQGGARDCLARTASRMCAEPRQRVRPAWAQVVRFRDGVCEVVGEWQEGRWLRWEAA